jgi:hypothetical protein
VRKTLISVQELEDEPRGRGRDLDERSSERSWTEQDGRGKFLRHEFGPRGEVWPQGRTLTPMFNVHLPQGGEHSLQLMNGVAVTGPILPGTRFLRSKRFSKVKL